MSVENSDVVIIINQEKKASTGEPFMTFKLLKRRYRPNDSSDKMRDIEYFNHPYAKNNAIRLIDDVNQEESISLISLATDLLPMEDSRRGKRNFTERKEEREEKERMKEKEKEANGILMETSFDFFDMDKSFYGKTKIET